MEHEKFIGSLDTLIKACKDGEAGFKRAAEDVDYPDLIPAFLAFSNERMEFAEELRRVSKNYNNPNPETEGTIMAAIHRELMDTRASISSETSIAVLEECIRGENSAIGDFEKVLQMGLPPYAKVVVESQYLRIVAVRDWVARFFKREEMKTAKSPPPINLDNLLK